MSSLKRMLLTGFGLGFLPVAPGTWGSLPPAIIFALMRYLELSAVLIAIVMVIFVLAGSFVCIRFSGGLATELGKKDPGQIVADEFAGQAVVFLILPVISSGIVVTAIAGFLLFRLFDIIKPWPIKKLEKLPNGWGILCDDLLAGIYAMIVLNVFLFLL